MTLNMQEQKASDVINTLIAFLDKGARITITGGECMQVSGEKLDNNLLKAMGFKYSSNKGFYWKQF